MQNTSAANLAILNLIQDALITLWFNWTTSTYSFASRESIFNMNAQIETSPLSGRTLSSVWEGGMWVYCSTGYIFYILQYKLQLCLLLLRTFLSSIPCFWSDTEALWSLPVRELPPICTDVRQKQRISIDTLPPEVKAPFPSDPIIPLRTKTTKEFQWVSSLQTLVPNPWHCPADSPKNQTFSAQNNKDYILGRTWSTLSNQVTGGTSESFTWQPSTHS